MLGLLRRDPAFACNVDLHYRTKVFTKDGGFGCGMSRSLAKFSDTRGVRILCTRIPSDLLWTFFAQNKQR